MASWRTEKSWSHEPQRGTDRDDYAYSARVTREGRIVHTTVEFASGGRAGNAARAREALAPFLAHEDPPPRRLLVDREGRVSVLEPAE